MGARLSTQSRQYQPGDLYSFRTEPVRSPTAYETNRYAALKVIGVSGRRICWVVLDGVFEAHPTLEAVRNLPWLRNTRFAFKGDPACRWAEPGKFDPPEMRYVGNLPLTPEEGALSTRCQTYSTFSTAAIDAEAEWRWRNERTAFEAEVEAERQASELRRKEEDVRRKERRAKLSFDALLAASFFERWSPSPPFPPKEFSQAAREQIRTTITALKALGPNPKRAEVRKALRACVEWFNAADDKYGGIIETEEREDICEILWDIAYAARQPALAEEIDAWRTW